MEVRLSRFELGKALAVSMDFASKSKNFPLLGTVSMTVSEDLVDIIATDIETASRYRVLCEGPATTGTVNLPVIGVRDFVTSTTADIVRIEHTPGKRAILECGRSRVCLSVIGDVFPDTPVTGSTADDGVTIGAPKLSSIFSRTSFLVHRTDGKAIGEGTVNPNTSAGVRLVCNGNITAIAHDGHRMARCVTEIDTGHKFELTVPPRPSFWLSGQRWDNSQPVLVSRTKAGITLSGGPLTVFFRSTDIRVPDTSLVFGPDYEYKATFNTKEFLRAVSSVSQFSDESAKGGRSVQLALKPDTATVITGGEFGESEATEDIACTSTGPAMTLEFDPRYLVEFARAGTSEAFDMRFNSVKERCRFTHHGDTEFVYVVGPRYREAR